MHRTSATASDSSLIWAIEQTRALGLRVTLKPYLDSEDGGWRADIDPADPDAWFAVYGAVITHYADLGRARGVDLLVIGSELIPMSTNPEYEGRWRSLISDVRARFPGKITYSANWGGEGFPEEFPRVPFWDALDYLGLSAYFELSSTGSPTVDDMVRRWGAWQREKLAPFQERWGKPVLFTEAGYRSVDGAARHPRLWQNSRSLDLQEQADCYQALFRAFTGVPWFAGVGFWNWNPDTRVSGSDTDYHVQNKPALGIVAAWFGGAYDELIYGDALASGLSDWSWDSTVNPDMRDAYTGTRALSWGINAPWGALYLRADSPIHVSAGTSLRFAVRRFVPGQQLRLSVYGVDDVEVGGPFLLPAHGDAETPGGWQSYTIPLRSLGISGGPIIGVSIGDVGGSAQPPIAVDDIALVNIIPSPAIRP